MAEIIKVSTEAMQQTLNVYSAQKNAQATAYQAMKNAVSSLDGIWTGAAASSYQGQFQAFYNNISQAEQKMEDAVTELRQSADLYTETEGTISGVVGGLDIGSSPFA